MKQPLSPPNLHAAWFQPARGRRAWRRLRSGQNRQGVALVVTMILLALISTLAIAFLGLTHRETRAVGNMQITTEAELTAEAGAERAKAMILAQLTTRNFFTNGMDVMGPDLMNSMAWDTNWIPPAPN